MFSLLFPFFYLTSNTVFFFFCNSRQWTKFHFKRILPFLSFIFYLYPSPLTFHLHISLLQNLIFLFNFSALFLFPTVLLSFMPFIFLLLLLRGRYEPAWCLSSSAVKVSVVPVQTSGRTHWKKNKTAAKASVIRRQRRKAFEISTKVGILALRTWKVSSLWITNYCTTSDLTYVTKLWIIRSRLRFVGDNEWLTKKILNV
jgi:hypothetical protein